LLEKIPDNFIWHLQGAAGSAYICDEKINKNQKIPGSPVLDGKKSEINYVYYLFDTLCRMNQRSNIKIGRRCVCGSVLENIKNNQKIPGSLQLQR
jgi:hypothetical protein